MAKVIKLYHCSECNYEAGTKYMVEKHIKKTHGKNK